MRLIRCLITLALLSATAAICQVRITPGPEKIQVEINGKPFTDFYIAGPEVTKPYLHPLRAASGTYVTRMWPMEKVAEEEKEVKDHQHQRGLWFAHDQVNGLDFWNNEASYTTPIRGKIVLKKLDGVTSGKDRGTISATFDWTNLKGELQLTETRVMTFYADPALRTIDIDVTLTAAQKVIFGDGKDGALAIRIRPVLQEDKGTGHISNADGMVTEKQAWGKPSNWCDYSGEINGEKVGIAVLNNPANPRPPGRFHVRAYGLLADNPFGLSVFTGDKTQNGAVTLEAGKSLRYRYRVIIHPGDVKSADIAGLWNRYIAGK